MEAKMMADVILEGFSPRKVISVEEGSNYENYMLAYKKLADDLKSKNTETIKDDFDNFINTFGELDIPDDQDGEEEVYHHNKLLDRASQFMSANGIKVA